MLIQKRTLENLRSSLSGKIYIYLEDTKTQKQFLKDAESEGYIFGKNKPTESPLDDIIALEKNKQISHVGFVGRVAFQCNGGSGADGIFHKIDYAKYKNGDKDFYFELTLKQR